MVRYYFKILQRMILNLIVNLESARIIKFNLKFICNALRDLVPFVQFKKREKHSTMGVFHVF